MESLVGNNNNQYLAWAVHV